MGKIYVRLRDVGSTFVVGKIVFVAKKPQMIDEEDPKAAPLILAAIRARALVKLTEQEYHDQMAPFLTAEELAKKAEEAKKEVTAPEGQETGKTAPPVSNEGGTAAPVAPVEEKSTGTKKIEDLSDEELKTELEKYPSVKVPKNAKRMYLLKLLKEATTAAKK